MTTANEVVYLDTLGAMRASMSSATTKEQRTHVDQFLSQLKEDRRCLEIMAHILTVQSANHDDYIRMLSLTILNDWLKIWWNKLSDAEQSSMRDTAIMLLHGPVGKSPVRGLWTKLAVMISNISVRQFPQMWPNFLEDMVSICIANSTTSDSSSFGGQEIAIMAIEFTASDSIDTDYCNSLPLQRRQDILAGFRKKLPELLGFAHGFLVQCSNRYSMLPPRDTASAENDNLRAHLMKLMGGLMRMMVPVSMFAKVEDLCDASRDFSLIAVQFLCEPDLQSDSAEFLSIMMRHKMPFDVLARLIEAIPRLSSPLLHASQHSNGSSSGSLPDDLFESLTFQRSYADIVFSLMGENVSQATDKYYLQSAPNALELLGKYFMLMANLISQPSWRLAGDVAKDWTKIFKEGSIANIPWMSDVCDVVLRVYSKKLERIVWEKEKSHTQSSDNDRFNSSPIDETAAAEFETHDEWVEHAGALKAQVMSLCGILGSKFPAVCVAFLRRRIVDLLSMPPSVSAGDANDADDVRQWQAFGFVFEFLSTEMLLPSDGTGLGTDGHKGQITQQLQEIVENVLNWSPSPFSSLQVQRLQCLQHCNAVFKASPLSLLQRVYADLFRHDSPLCSAKTQGCSVSSMAVSEKATNIVAQLSHVCGSLVVTDESLLNAIVAQIMNMIAVRKVQVPSNAAEFKSLQNQKGCLRESLVALSEQLHRKPAQQKELLVMSLADIVADWQGICVGTGLFSTPQTFLDGCYQGSPSVVSVKDIMGVLLSSSKRVTCSALPESVWVVSTSPSPSELSAQSLLPLVDKALPFLAVWQAVLPGMQSALKSLHGVLEPALRLSLANTQSMGLYLPPISMVRRAAGLSPHVDDAEGLKAAPSLPGVTAEIAAVGKHVGEVRIMLYQLLGQACSHRALYVYPELSAVIADLGSMLPWLENYQLSQLMKIFVESFVLNAPPVVFDIVASFLESFLVTTFRRLSTCWTDDISANPMSAEEGLLLLVHRECSVPQGFGGLDNNQVENARKSLCAELTRTYGDLLSSFACCRGYLAADMPTSAAHQSASMLGISTVTENKGPGGGVGRGKKGKKALSKPLDSAPVEQSVVTIPGTDTQQLLQHKAVRRKALYHILLGNPRYSQAVTAPYVASSVSLIGIADTTVARKGLQLGNYLATRCRDDRRLLVAVGRDAFSAALSVLLQQEAWSEGIESEVIEFLATVYELLVFGEMLGPDGSILTPPSATQKTSNDQKGPGPGFGSMSGWQGPGRGASNSNSNSSSNSNRNSATNSRNNSNSNLSGQVSSMLSDLPRQVILTVQSITPISLEALETQMLGTTSRKKRREYLKDFLKSAGVGRGSDVAVGKRVEAAVMDIRHRMAPQLGRKKAVPHGSMSSFFGTISSLNSGAVDGELNLSSFFGD